jgi:hypothetical protein
MRPFPTHDDDPSNGGSYRSTDAPAGLEGAVPFDPFVVPVDQAEVCEEVSTPAAELAGSSGGILGRLSARALRIPAAVAGMSAIVIAVILLFTQPQRAQTAPDQVAAEELALVAFEPDDPYTFRGLDIHPDRMFAEYFGGAFITDAEADSIAATAHRDFRYRMEMYRRAYGVDDNFTISVYDDRTGERLESATLSSLRAEYNLTGRIDWDVVDAHRRDEGRRLRTKWLALGIPQEDLTIRWGRANQTHEARTRDEPFLSYELQLARRLGLSLLATEIGTVETFNQDHLVSSAGARSRYQLMPDVMAMFDVMQYQLPLASGGTVEVREERHPLLSMEPSMMLVRAYSNAVGHELPGISAYHTGPGNIFILYQAYIRAHAANPPVNGHVSDAYMWGVTDGFERVDAVSSFGPESRAYVMKAYGALRATENEVVDPEGTLRAERVQLRREAIVSLSRLLQLLQPADLDWGEAGRRTGLYGRFRVLNPHIALPAAPLADSANVPLNGDVRLSNTADGKPVRFFLPSGAADYLRRAGYDLFGNVTQFDERTFVVEPRTVTRVDRDYEALVEDIGRFGFTTANRARLDAIAGQLQALAAANPGNRYRETQAHIARIHQSLWRTRGFRDLASTVDTFLSYLPARRRAAESAGVAVDSVGGGF